MNSSFFKEISIRGRVGYSILCLENAIKYYHKESLDWDFIKKLLWSFTVNDCAKWHYPMAEAIPRSVLFDASYKEKEMEFLTEQEYIKLKALYLNSNADINFIIDKTFEIGTRDLYSSIVNYSMNTLIYLDEIIISMNHNTIPLPDMKPFKKFSIYENDGWGRGFKKEDI